MKLTDWDQDDTPTYDFTPGTEAKGARVVIEFPIGWRNSQAILGAPSVATAAAMDAMTKQGASQADAARMLRNIVEAALEVSDDA